MQAVLKISAVDDFALWPVRERESYSHLVLNGELTPAEVGTARCALASPFSPLTACGRDVTTSRSAPRSSVGGRRTRARCRGRCARGAGAVACAGKRVRGAAPGGEAGGAAGCSEPSAVVAAELVGKPRPCLVRRPVSPPVAASVRVRPVTARDSGRGRAALLPACGDEGPRVLSWTGHGWAGLCRGCARAPAPCPCGQRHRFVPETPFNWNEIGASP